MITGQIKGRKVWNSIKNIQLMLFCYAALSPLWLGVLALPVMLFWKDRARFYSYLHRVWSKTSDKPVWMEQAEKVTCDFY
ncbi:Protein of uncharacterised function (DUF2517) [Citrobacter koseri]|uniref:Protein of uncharacterized function (DUF2517) n=1 Tax=Citrobacter koseri TaxID=545 RepID=A0A2X2URN5_CITKO|nr:Protein of uncharacterised function (DUF2517) [Citrobacter koseri]